MEQSEPFSNMIANEGKIEMVMFEPSFLCQLDCPACFPSRKDRRKVKVPPYNMPLELFKKVIDDICKAGLTVDCIDFKGRGEPLMNGDVWKMARYARDHFPESTISIDTNGNFEYAEDSINAGLSQLYVCVDGCFQDSYEIYRRKGDIDKAFGFMEQFAKAKKRCGKSTELVWKYLLFGHNDSDSELIEAQKKAMELGVDALFFLATPLVQSCKRSRFFEKDNLKTFPRINTGASSLKILAPDEIPFVKDFLDRVDKVISSLTHDV
jgi:wyosine [tRNA(Phe)-imidazoG37] synthetase (radical SAM superfamily)